MVTSDRNPWPLPKVPAIIMDTYVTNIFFHIGMYKMATTWFPRQLFPSLDGGSRAPNISTKLQQRWTR